MLTRILTAVFFLVMFASESRAVTITSNTNWSSITPTPNATTTILVKNGATLTVDVANAVADEVSLGAGGGFAGNGTLKFNAGSQLVLSGSNGTLSLGLSAFYGGTLDMSLGGALYAKGINGSGSGNIIPGSGFIEINGSAGLHAGLTTFNNLTLNAAPSTLNLSTGITVNGALNITGGTLSTSTSNFPLTVNGNINIASGATFQPNNSTVNVKGNFTNAGTFAAAGSTIILSGATTQNISGTNTFNNLTINNTATATPQITLSNNTNVNGIFNMIAGDINLNSKTLTLGSSSLSTGNLSYTSGTLYGGTFTRYIGSGALTASGGLFPVGRKNKYNPVTITTTADATTGGTVSVTPVSGTSSFNVDAPFFDNGATVARMHESFYTVSTSNVSGGTYAMRIAGNGWGTIGNVNDLRIVKTTGQPGIATLAPGTDGAHTGTITNPQVNRTGLTLANLSNNFTVGSINAVNTPLPIALLYFNAVAKNNLVELFWATASETNNDFFAIEKSNDGRVFTEVKRLGGSGNSVTQVDYACVDSTPFVGSSYYRLKQVDFDGSISYSNVVSVRTNVSQPFIAVSPNPFHTSFNLIFANDDAPNKVVTVFDMSGNVLYNQTLRRDQMQTEIDMSRFSGGTYILKITEGSQTLEHNIVKAR